MLPVLESCTMFSVHEAGNEILTSSWQADSHRHLAEDLLPTCDLPVHSTAYSCRKMLVGDVPNSTPDPAIQRDQPLVQGDEGARGKNANTNAIWNRASQEIQKNLSLSVGGTCAQNCFKGNQTTLRSGNFKLSKTTGIYGRAEAACKLGDDACCHDVCHVRDSFSPCP